MDSVHPIPAITLAGAASRSCWWYHTGRLSASRIPANAIHAEDDLPANMQQFLGLNRTLSAVWPVITACGQVPADAAEWDGVEGKLRYLDLPEKVA